MQEYEREIEVTSKFLKKLDKASQVGGWAKEHDWKIGVILDGYDQLVAVLNSVTDDFSVLDVMPKTKILKKVLGGVGIPYTRDIFKGNYAKALFEARGPMILGQKIKKGEIQTPTLEKKNIAIGTPSMDTTLAALAVGTIGHLSERTFFQWARKRGLEPDGGWKKDDWLQALDEGFMLMLARREMPILYEFFLKSNKNGGLGWLNNEKVEKFRMKLGSLV